MSGSSSSRAGAAGPGGDEADLLNTLYGGRPALKFETVQSYCRELRSAAADLGTSVAGLVTHRDPGALLARLLLLDPDGSRRDPARRGRAVCVASLALLRRGAALLLQEGAPTNNNNSGPSAAASAQQQRSIAWRAQLAAASRRDQREPGGLTLADVKEVQRRLRRLATGAAAGRDDNVVLRALEPSALGAALVSLTLCAPEVPLARWRTVALRHVDLGARRVTFVAGGAEPPPVVVVRQLSKDVCAKELARLVRARELQHAGLLLLRPAAAAAAEPAGDDGDGGGGPFLFADPRAPAGAAFGSASAFTKQSLSWIRAAFEAAGVERKTAGGVTVRALRGACCPPLTPPPM